MSRLNDPDCDIDPAERAVAIAIREAAERAQDIFYYQSDVALQLPSETREMLVRLYRGLCIATRHYFEEGDHGLLWKAPPPATQFKKVRR